MRKTAVCFLTVLAALSSIHPVAAAGGLVVGSGPLTVQALPGGAQEDLPVCADSTTGQLGPCDPTGPGVAKMVWVAKNGTGDYDDPVAAMDDVTTWCPAPSAVNPCVLKIAPGHYFLTAPLKLENWVTVQGSGPDSTILRRLADQHPGKATVISHNVTSSSRLENLSIHTTGGATNLGILADHDALADLVVRNVSLYSFSSGGFANIGLEASWGASGWRT